MITLHTSLPTVQARSIEIFWKDDIFALCSLPWSVSPELAFFCTISSATAKETAHITYAHLGHFGPHLVKPSLPPKRMSILSSNTNEERLHTPRTRCTRWDFAATCDTLNLPSVIINPVDPRILTNITHTETDKQTHSYTNVGVVFLRKRFPFMFGIFQSLWWYSAHKANPLRLAFFEPYSQPRNHNSCLESSLICVLYLHSSSPQLNSVLTKGGSAFFTHGKIWKFIAHRR